MIDSFIDSCRALVTFLSPQLVKQELNLWNMSSGSLEGVATHQSCARIYVAIFKLRPQLCPASKRIPPVFISVFLLLIYADCNRATRENTLCRKTWQPCRDQGIMGIISWVASPTSGHPPHPVTCQLQFMRCVANLLRICCLQSWQQFGIRLIISQGYSTSSGSPSLSSILMTCKLIATSTARIMSFCA